MKKLNAQTDSGKMICWRDDIRGQNDISTIYAYRKDGTVRSWSMFNGDYDRGEEYSFIEDIDSKPNDYTYYLISWCTCA